MFASTLALQIMLALRNPSPFICTMHLQLLLRLLHFTLLASGILSEIQLHIENLCQHSIWLAASPGIGNAEPENPPDSLQLFWTPDVWKGSIWARTKCTLNTSNYFSCETGDCGSGTEACQGPPPAYPVTLLNFDINNSVVSYELSMIHGQNLMARIHPNGGRLVHGSGPCPVVDCIKDLGDVCPSTLVAYNDAGVYVGCNSYCDVFKDRKHCCDRCGPDYSSKAFKNLCGLARIFPGDKTPPVYKCKGAKSYNISFCAY